MMEEKIIVFLSDVRPEFNFRETSDYIRKGLLDSFDILQLVVSLDTEFGISIDGMDILPENFSSIEAISQLLIKNGIAK